MKKVFFSLFFCGMITLSFAANAKTNVDNTTSNFNPEKSSVLQVNQNLEALRAELEDALLQCTLVARIYCGDIYIEVESTAETCAGAGQAIDEFADLVTCN